MYTETDTTIEFAFPLVDIEQSVSVQSMYSTKNMQSTVPDRDVLDLYGLTADEKMFIEMQLKRALCDLFSAFINQTAEQNDSMFDERQVDGVACCGFSIKRESCDVISLYNSNRLSIIDQNCMDFLKHYLLLEWAKTNKIADDVTIYQNAVIQNMRVIVQQNAEIKKGLYVKTYNITKE